MPTPPKYESRRVAQLRRDNPVMDRPPVAIVQKVAVQSRSVSFAYAAPESVAIKRHRVGKSGSVHIAGLPKGVEVNVAQVDAQTYVVSSRSEAEVRSLAAQLPPVASSPFSRISMSLSGQSHSQANEQRARGPFMRELVLKEISDEDALRGADTTRAQRRR